MAGYKVPRAFAHIYLTDCTFMRNQFRVLWVTNATVAIISRTVFHDMLQFMGAGLPTGSEHNTSQHK